MNNIYNLDDDMMTAYEALSKSLPIFKQIDNKNHVFEGAVLTLITEYAKERGEDRKEIISNLYRTVMSI